MRRYQRHLAFGQQVTIAITEYCKTWVQGKYKRFYCLLEASVFSSLYLLNACWMMVVALCFQRTSFALASHAAAMYSVTCSSWSYIGKARRLTAMRGTALPTGGLAFLQLAIRQIEKGSSTVPCVTFPAQRLASPRKHGNAINQGWKWMQGCLPASGGGNYRKRAARCN